MEIDHVHFYVEDAPSWRDWCCNTLGFCAQGGWQTQQTHCEVMVQGNVNFVCSSPLTAESPVAEYLRQHPPGVADLALRVNNLHQCLQQARLSGAKLNQPSQGYQWPQGQAWFAQVQGWGNLRHTLVQRQGQTGVLPAVEPNGKDSNPSTHTHITHIDHAVLNVAAPDFEAAMGWYERVFGFQRQQRFEIQTRRSGLCSQVLTHPQGGAQLPINAPMGQTSQIQEFLDWNRGSGIQHLALHSPNLIAATQRLRQWGLKLLSTPASYYHQLAQAGPNSPVRELGLDVECLAQAQILADWQVEPKGSVLLQIFSQPIFAQPTFFFEFIERRERAQGFGEGNFLALFEAIEREQVQRGAVAPQQV